MRYHLKSQPPRFNSSLQTTITY